MSRTPLNHDILGDRVTDDCSAIREICVVLTTLGIMPELNRWGGTLHTADECIHSLLENFIGHRFTSSGHENHSEHENLGAYDKRKTCEDIGDLLDKSALLLSTPSNQLPFDIGVLPDTLYRGLPPIG